jgi:hypothetical protein
LAINLLFIVLWKEECIAVCFTSSSLPPFKTFQCGGMCSTHWSIFYICHKWMHSTQLLQPLL